MKTSTAACLAAALILATFNPASGGRPGDETIPSAWAAAPAKIDGDPEDWAGSSFALWSKGDVDYAFRNDAANLYIVFVFKNPKFRSTVEPLGMNVYFNAAGKKNKDYAILFVKKQMSADQAIAYLEKESSLSEDEKAQMRTKPAYNVFTHAVTNKDAKSEALAPGVLPPPALFRYAPQKQTLVYEFAVPLPRIHELAAGAGAEPGQTLMIGFEWGGPTEAQRKQAARAAGDAGIANEQVTGRGGRVEDLAGGRGGRVPPKYSFWAEVKLAEKI
jgi:hypothetical protein